MNCNAYKGAITFSTNKEKDIRINNYFWCIMAMNTTVLKTRTTTALIFVIIMLVGIGTNAYTLFALCSIIHFGAWWEYFTLQDKVLHTTSHNMLRMGFALTGYTMLIWCSGSMPQLQQLQLSSNFGVLVGTAGFLCSVIGIFKMQRITMRVLHYMWGYLYISLSLACLLLLCTYTHNTEYTHQLWLSKYLVLPAFVISCMWINDTMAYLVGSLIGRTPLSSISPKKTWEGTLGGIVLCGVVVGVGTYYIASKQHFEYSIWHWIMLATVASILGTIGDLLESKLKRMAQVKDSGSFMPGHGGFLDRFDSLLFATPFMYILIKLID